MIRDPFFFLCFFIRICLQAAKGIWNIVARMSSDRSLIEACLKSGIVGGLCGAARGASDLLQAFDEVRDSRR